MVIVPVSLSSLHYVVSVRHLPCIHLLLKAFLRSLYYSSFCSTLIYFYGVWRLLLKVKTVPHKYSHWGNPTHDLIHL